MNDTTHTGPRHLDPSVRHEFVLLIECVGSNPNGDPDNDNMPRIDLETSQGLMTDASVKRKVRDYVSRFHPEERNKIYVAERAVLNEQHRRAYTALGMVPKSKEYGGDKVREWMLDNFYDLRMFGGVMTTEINAGQVLGAVQIGMGRSVSPITPVELTITRTALTSKPKAKKGDEGKEAAQDGDPTRADSGTMGRRSLVPYGLYRIHGSYNAREGVANGVTSEDLQLLWDGLVQGFESSRSASRPEVSCCGLIVYSHDSQLGNQQARRSWADLRVAPKEGVETPRSTSDYRFEFGDVDPRVERMLLVDPRE